MPIILLWNATVAGAEEEFARLFNSFERSTFLIERWMEKRLRETEVLERRTIGIPVIRFYNEAVSAQVAAYQFAALLDAPVESVGAHLERGLAQWNVPRRIAIAVRENRLLPELFRVLEEITAGVLASIRRFERPTAAMFNVNERQASDLPGLAVLAFRALGSSRTQILGAARNVREALGPQQPEESRPETAEAPWGAVATAYAFQLDEVARYVVAGILIIPALGRLVATIGGDALIVLRYRALEWFEQMEGRAFAFRRRVLTFFVTDLHAYARKGLLLLLVAREMAVGYIQFFARVGIEYVRGVVDGVSGFATQLQTFWTGVAGVIQNVLTFGNVLIHLNIGHTIHAALVAVKDTIEVIDEYFYPDDEHPKPYVPPREFPLTIEEFVLHQGPGVRAHAELNKAVILLVKAWDGASLLRRGLGGYAIYRFLDIHIPMTIAAVTWATIVLSVPPGPLPAQPTLTFNPGTVPDLNAEIIQPLREGATRAVNDAVTGVTQAVDGIVGTVGRTLDATAVAFDRAAAHAAQVGSLHLLRRITSNTDALLNSLFAGQDTPAEPTGLEPVAGAYAQWLIQGGFDTIGAVMGGYIGFMLDEWESHLLEGRDTPVEMTATSPRHLLQRARLGRVHTPALRITARAQALGRPLAALIADRFQEAVQGAFETGERRFRGMVEVTP